MKNFDIRESINIKPWCVKIETALANYPDLIPYVKNGKLDFGDHDTLTVYNKAVAYSLAKLKLEVNQENLIPAVCLRHAYMKIVTEIYIGSGKKVLEIGTGASAIIALLGAKLYHHHITASEINDKSIESARNNVQKNNLTDRINLKKSEGGILFGVIPKGSYFDALLSYPPTYGDSAQDEGKLKKNRGFKGVESEMIGGGIDGFDFTKNLLTEACSDQFDIKLITVLCLFKSHVGPSIQILQSHNKKVDVIELVAGTRKRYLVVGY